MSRKRINISVDEEMYRKLQHIKEAYGFRNVCEFNVAMLNILCRYIEDAESRTKIATQTDSEMITEMFNELGSWERTPDGTVPVRHPNTDMEKNGKR